MFSGHPTPWHPVPWYVFWHRLRGHKWYRWTDKNSTFHTDWEMEFASDQKLARSYLEENFGDA